MRVVTQSFDTRADEPISRGRYIAGGALGTVFGFGLGHAVSGEYSSTGWVFTTSELASAALFSTGFLFAVSSIEGDQSLGTAGGIMVLVGGLAFAGLRLWEIGDIWTRPKVYGIDVPVVERKPSQASHFVLLPTATGREPGLSLTAIF